MLKLTSASGWHPVFFQKEFFEDGRESWRRLALFAISFCTKEGLQFYQAKSTLVPFLRNLPTMVPDSWTKESECKYRDYMWEFALKRLYSAMLCYDSICYKWIWCSFSAADCPRPVASCPGEGSVTFPSKSEVCRCQFWSQTQNLDLIADAISICTVMLNDMICGPCGYAWQLAKREHWIEIDLKGMVTRFNAKIVRHEVIMLLWTDHSAAVIAALFLSEQILSERATDDTIRIYSLSLCLCFFAFQGRLSMLPPQAEVARRKSQLRFRGLRLDELLIVVRLSAWYKPWQLWLPRLDFFRAEHLDWNC